MPTIAFETKTKYCSEIFTLILVARHRLQVGEPSAKTHMEKNAPPSCIDVVLGSSFTVTISGKYNGNQASSKQLRSSRIAQHLVQHLRMNLTELGLDTISELYISDSSDDLTVSCTTSRVCRHMDTGLPHLRLLGFDLEYIWKDKSFSSSNPSTTSESSVNPFSVQLAIPYIAAVDSVLDRFLTFQVVKRYPFSFAYWCRQLDVEQEFFTTLFTSLRTLAERSGSPLLMEAYKKQMKAIRRNVISRLSFAHSELAEYLSVDLDDHTIELDDESIFKLSLEHIFRAGMKRRQFKRLTKRLDYAADRNDDDELLDLNAISACHLGFDEEVHSDDSQDGDNTDICVQTPFGNDNTISLLENDILLDLSSDSEKGTLFSLSSPPNAAKGDEDLQVDASFGAVWDDDNPDGSFSQEPLPVTSPLWGQGTDFRLRSPRFTRETRNYSKSDLGDPEITVPDQHNCLMEVDLFDDDDEHNLIKTTFSSSQSFLSTPRSASLRPWAHSHCPETSCENISSVSDELTNKARNVTLEGTCSDFYISDDFSGMGYCNEDDEEGHVPLGLNCGWTDPGSRPENEGSSADCVIFEGEHSLVFQNVDLKPPMDTSLHGTDIFCMLPLTALDAVQDYEFSAVDFEG